VASPDRIRKTRFRPETRLNSCACPDAARIAPASATTIGDAGRVAPLDKLSVVLVAVFGVLFLGERLAPHHWLGVGLIAAGAGPNTATRTTLSLSSGATRPASPRASARK
jgi:hypothetical protein